MITLCYKEIRVSPKITALPSGTLPQTVDFENFATACRSSTVEFVDDTYDGRRIVAVYCTSVSHKPLTPSLRFVVDLLLNLFLQLFSM